MLTPLVEIEFVLDLAIGVTDRLCEQVDDHVIAAELQALQVRMWEVQAAIVEYNDRTSRIHVDET